MISSVFPVLVIEVTFVLGCSWYIVLGIPCIIGTMLIVCMALRKRINGRNGAMTRNIIGSCGIAII